MFEMFEIYPDKRKQNKRKLVKEVQDSVPLHNIVLLLCRTLEQ